MEMELLKREDIKIHTLRQVVNIIYDNTEMLKLVMVFNDGKMIWKDNKIPNWLNINFK